MKTDLILESDFGKMQICFNRNIIYCNFLDGFSIKENSYMNSKLMGWFSFNINDLPCFLSVIKSNVYKEKTNHKFSKTPLPTHKVQMIADALENCFIKNRIKIEKFMLVNLQSDAIEDLKDAIENLKKEIADQQKEFADKQKELKNLEAGLIVLKSYIE